jgi:hypothetical protein
VYKQGQAGVTKATVSVTFNNENTYNMPQGYDKVKKIVVTRQARFSRQLVSTLVRQHAATRCSAM